MFDAKDGGERRREPERGDASSHAEPVRRIGKGHVIRERTERGGKAQRVATMNEGRLLCTERRDVRLERGKTLRRQLDELCDGSASGKSLEPEGTGAGEKIEDAGARQLRHHDAHP